MAPASSSSRTPSEVGEPVEASVVAAATSFLVWDVPRGTVTSLAPRGDCLEQQLRKLVANMQPHGKFGPPVRLDGFGPQLGDDGKPVAVLGGGHLEHHGFLQTLDIAYNHHLGLRLKPDDIWLLLAMGFSTHINLDPERHRSQLVGFEGKQVIRIREDSLVPGNGAHNDWLGCNIFGRFSQEIRKYVGEELHGKLIADFSTTTPLDRAVSELTLMNVTQAFFDFEVEGRCGIPEVTLEGTLEDWRSVRERAEAFAPFGLEWWLEDLRFVLDEFVAAKEGRPNVPFWHRIFRGDHYEGQRYMEPDTNFVSGWVHVFFPYLEGGVRNEGRETVEEHRRRVGRAYADLAAPCAQCGAGGRGAADGDSGKLYCQRCWRWWDVARFYKHRVNAQYLQPGLRSTPFLWDFCYTEYDCEFVAGFVGCTAVGTDEVRPQLGFCVRNKGLKKKVV